MHTRVASRLILAVSLLLAAPVFAQGVTGSAVTGTVHAADGAPIKGAMVELTNPATGARFTATTGDAGRYTIDNVPPGGPFTIGVTAEGYQTTSNPGIQLTLGQRSSVDVVMHKEMVEEIAVIAHTDQLGDKERTGAGSTQKSAQIVELPLQGRNFTDLTVTDARVVPIPGGGFAIAGQNNRFNNIQIDGGANNDLFGLAASGTPGGNAAAKPLSIEAVQEFNIMVAPFDVRYGNFAGGLVNAVTKSGTNDFHGTVFGYYQNKSLAGFQSDPTFTDYHTLQYGVAIGGPIIQDKVHFFLAADLQSKVSAFGSPNNITGNDRYDIAHAGFTKDTAQRFINDLAKYGITNAGDYTTPNINNPDHDLFVKISTSAIENSNLEISYNLVNANQDTYNRAVTSPSPPSAGSPGRVRDGYQLTDSGYTFNSTTQSIRGKLSSNWGEGMYSNELLAGASFIRENRSTPTNAPLIIVDANCVADGCAKPQIGSSDPYLAAGGERFSQDNLLDQDVWDLSDNLSFSPIDNHRVTVGTSNEYFTFRNTFLQASTGAWFFSSLDAFEAGQALAYQRRFAGSPDVAPGQALFHVTQLGLYAQDEWTPLKNLTVSPGIRMDVPILSAAARNDAYFNVPGFPIDTSAVPSGNILWSPRLGFNWDVEGNADTVVRGGVGIFSGRPPYVWVSNAYTVNGLSQVELDCFTKTPPAPAKGGAGVPAFTADPNNQPTNCTGTPGNLTVPPGEVDYFDPNTKYPQNLRYALGMDKRLPFGIVASVDLLYTRDINGWYTTDTNLQSEGNDPQGRPLYGTPTSGGTYSPVRYNTSQFIQAVEVYNKNGGHSYSGTVQLQKAWGRKFSLSVAYTYSRSYDRISFTSSQALSNLQFEPLDGPLDHRAITPSDFDRPHKITVTGTAGLPYGFLIGLNYVGVSGTPYTYVTSNDVNGDGISGNDLVFVPKDSSQISISPTSPGKFSDLQAFINSQSCLRDAAGGYIHRNACRNPWVDFLDMRVSWQSPKFKGEQQIEVQWDIFNVLNLINSSWGHNDQVAQFATGPSFLKAVGFDAANNRPIYNVTLPSSIVSTVYSPTSSRWRMQFGARYMF